MIERFNNTVFFKNLKSLFIPSNFFFKNFIVSYNLPNERLLSVMDSYKIFEVVIGTDF